MQTEIDILEGIRAAYEAHARECDQPPKAILLHPGNHDLVGWDEAFGLPVLPDERPEPMRMLLVCGTGVGGYCAQGDVYWDDDGQPYVAEADLDAA